MGQPVRRSYKKAGEFVTEAVADEVVLIVNGAERRVPAGSTLADLLASLKVDARTVVIERNGTIIARPILGGLHHRYARIE